MAGFAAQQHSLKMAESTTAGDDYLYGSVSLSVMFTATTRTSFPSTARTFFPFFSELHFSEAQSRLGSVKKLEDMRGS